MNCEHDWTIQIKGSKGQDLLEARPITMNLKLSRNQYDFCRATFDGDVGDVMEPETLDGGRLNSLLPADIVFDGQPIKRLLFRPDWVDFSEDRTDIQFKDIHKALSETRVDMKIQNVNLKDVYKEIINSVPNTIIPEISDDNFIIDDSTVRKIYGDIDTNVRAPGEEAIADDQTIRAVESNYAVDFQGITGEEAIAKLNSMFYLKTWASAEGELYIGLPEKNQINHVAADKDERVWRYKNPRVSQGREPIKTALVKGPWIDAPGIGNIEDIKNFFNPDKNVADYHLYGIAQRTDIDSGLKFTAEAPDATKASLPEIAVSALKEKMKQQKSGRVEIDPELSGYSVSHPADVRPGDTIRLVEPDKGGGGGFGCRTFSHDGNYLISEVEHNVQKSGHWDVYADIGIYPEFTANSSIAYFDPSESSWVTDSEIASDGDLKGGWYERENT